MIGTENTFWLIVRANWTLAERQKLGFALARETHSLHRKK